MSRVDSPLKSPLKTMNGKLVLDTQMRMHSKSHLLQMKSQKLNKEQKKLNTDRTKLDKDILRLRNNMKANYEEEFTLANEIQLTVGFDKQQELYDEEIKFNDFLKNTLESVQKLINEPLPSKDERSEEELEETLNNLIAENERITGSKKRLEKQAHIENYHELVEELSAEVHQHEQDATESEKKAADSQNANHEEDIILNILDERLAKAIERKEKAINNLVQSDLKKKKAITRNEAAKARREEAEKQKKLISEQEADLQQREDEFYNISRQNPLEEEEDQTDMLKSIIRSPYQRTHQLAPKQKRKSQMEVVLTQYEKVLNGNRRKDKNDHLFNDHINMYKDEEATRWNDHMNSQLKETEKELKRQQSDKSNEELEQTLDRVNKKIEELSDLYASQNHKLEENGRYQQPNLEKETSDERFIKIPDYETEIDNIRREYIYISEKTAADTREKARQTLLQELAIGAEKFNDTIKDPEESSSSSDSEIGI